MTENSEDNDENNMFKYLGSLCDVSYDVPKIVYESSISSEEESNFRFS